jgi:hypothetical protein
MDFFPNVWVLYLFWQKTVWATFWATFSQTHRVTLMPRSSVALAWKCTVTTNLNWLLALIRSLSNYSHWKPYSGYLLQNALMYANVWDSVWNKISSLKHFNAIIIRATLPVNCINHWNHWNFTLLFSKSCPKSQFWKNLVGLRMVDINTF